MSLHEPAPDLRIYVRESRSHGRTTLTFKVEAHSRFPDIGGEFGPTEFCSDLPVFFRRFFEDIENLSGGTAQKKIEARGADLAQEILPEDLRTLLWELQGRVKTVQIVSDEAAIPWELLYLGRHTEDGWVGRQFLCEAFALTRWRPIASAPLHLPMKRLALVVTDDHNLPEVIGEEADVKSRQGPGREVKSIPAAYAPLIEEMAQGRYDGWHFVGHGVVASKSPYNWEIPLADDPSTLLTPRDIAAEASNLGRARPFFFLNGCRTGQGGMALTRVGGWASKLLDIGVGAFLGSSWAIRDQPARRFAKVFYDHFLGGQAMGEAVRQARFAIRKEFPDDPTWLAYCVYAHPLARVVPVRRPAPRRRTAVGMAMILLAILAGGGLTWLQRPRPHPLVAVLGFETETKQPWLALAVAEMLHEHLEAGSGLRMADRDRIAEIEHFLGRNDPVSEAEKAALLRRSLGVDYLVRGICQDGTIPGQIRVRFYLYDTRKDKGSYLIDLKRPADDVFGLVRDAATSLRKDLNVPALTLDQELETKASFPFEPEAAKPYFEGLAAYREFQTLKARSLLEKAVEAGGHPLVRDALARVLVDLGRDDLARQELVQTRESSQRLSERKQLELRARRYHFDGDWGEEARIYDKLYATFADEVDYCILSAEARLAIAEPEEALETAVRCRETTLSLRDEARLALVVAGARLDQGDLEGALESARKAVRKGDQSNGYFLVGLARFREAVINARLGDDEAFDTNLKQAREVFARAASVKELAKTCVTTGYSLAENARLEEARKILAACLDVYRTRNGETDGTTAGWPGQEVQEALIGSMLASVLIEEGRQLDEAHDELEKAKRIFVEVGDRYRAADAAVNLGVLAHNDHRLEEAWDFYIEAAQVYRDLGDDFYLATSLTNLGEVLYFADSLAEAVRVEEFALAIHTEIAPDEVPYDRFRLGEALAALGRDDEARRHLEFARAELNGEVLLALARFELSRENFGDARRFADQAMTVLEDEKPALALLARIVRLRESLRLPESERSAEELYNSVRVEWIQQDDPRIRLEGALLKILWEGRRRSSWGEADFEDLLDAATVAARAGYLRTIDEARHELSALAPDGVLTRLDRMLENRSTSWEPRVRQALALLETDG